MAFIVFYWVLWKIEIAPQTHSLTPPFSSSASENRYKRTRKSVPNYFDYIIVSNLYIVSCARAGAFCAHNLKLIVTRLHCMNINYIVMLAIFRVELTLWSPITEELITLQSRIQYSSHFSHATQFYIRFNFVKYALRQ